ncbi:MULTISPECIES: hypothetical protein [Arenibacter]|nr:MULTISPECIES: hypothetical protein [Arenibacter]
MTLIYRFTEKYLDWEVQDIEILWETKFAIVRLTTSPKFIPVAGVN